VGVKTFSSTIQGSVNGNAGTATTADKVANSLTAGAFLTGDSYDGSGAVTLAVQADSDSVVKTVVARDDKRKLCGECHHGHDVHRKFRFCFDGPRTLRLAR
jgi:hypothetical protein